MQKPPRYDSPDHDVKIEPRLQGSGGYERATLMLQATTPPTPEVVQALTLRAVALNRELGDPTRAGASAHSVA